MNELNSALREANQIHLQLKMAVAQHVAGQPGMMNEILSLHKILSVLNDRINAIGYQDALAAGAISPPISHK